MKKALRKIFDFFKKNHIKTAGEKVIFYNRKMSSISACKIQKNEEFFLRFTFRVDLSWRTIDLNVAEIYQMSSFFVRNLNIDFTEKNSDNFSNVKKFMGGIFSLNGTTLIDELVIMSSLGSLKINISFRSSKFGNKCFIFFHGGENPSFEELDEKEWKYLYNYLKETNFTTH